MTDLDTQYNSLRGVPRPLVYLAHQGTDEGGNYSVKMTVQSFTCIERRGKKKSSYDAEKKKEKKEWKREKRGILRP